MKPYFINDPEDVTTLSGEDVKLRCDVNGDPEPSVIWHTHSGMSGDSLDPQNPLELQSFTYCAHPGRPVDGLDQLWYSPAALRCVVRLVSCLLSQQQKGRGRECHLSSGSGI